MGGGPSKDEIIKEQEFLWRVAQQQKMILNENVAEIQDFFKSVDALVATKGNMDDYARVWCACSVSGYIITSS